MYANQAAQTVGLSGSVGSYSEPATKVFEVTGQLDSLDRNIRGLQDLISMVEARLAPVTRAEPPQNATAGNAQLRGVPQTKLGQHLQEFNDVTAMCRDRLDSLLSRLEL